MNWRSGAIFGQASEDVKNESLEAPAGMEGIVIGADKYTRKGLGSASQQEASAERKKKLDRLNREMAATFRELMAEISKVTGGEITQQRPRCLGYILALVTVQFLDLHCSIQ